MSKTTEERAWELYVAEHSAGVSEGPDGAFNAAEAFEAMARRRGAGGFDGAAEREEAKRARIAEAPAAEVKPHVPGSDVAPWTLGDCGGKGCAHRGTQHIRNSCSRPGCWTPTQEGGGA